MAIRNLLLTAISETEQAIQHSQSALAASQEALAEWDALYPSVDPNIGKTWKAGSIPGSGWHGSACEPTLGKCFACSSFGSGIAETSDGKTWTIGHSSGAEFKGAAAGGGVAVFVSKNGPVIRYDGTYQSVSASSSRMWHDAAYSPTQDRFVAVAQDGGTGETIMYSDDKGVTWIGVNSPISAGLQAVDWAEDLQVWAIIAETGSGPRFAYTEDLASPDWTIVDIPVHNYKDLIRNLRLGLWVAVASGGQIAVAANSDGPWTVTTDFVGSLLHGVDYVHETGRIVITGESGPEDIITSDDGVTFIGEPNDIAGSWQNPAYFPNFGMMTVIGLGGAKYSPDDTVQPSPPPPPPPPPPGSGLMIDQHTLTADASSYSHPVSFGEGGRIVVTIHAGYNREGPPVQAVTIDGIAATKIAEKASSETIASVWEASGIANASGTIDVQYSGQTRNSHVRVYRPGDAPVTASYTDEAAPLTFTADIPDNAVVIAAATGRNQNITWSWDGLAEDEPSSGHVEGINTSSTASGVLETAQTGVTVTATASGSLFGASGVLVVFG